VQPA